MVCCLLGIVYGSVIPDNLSTKGLTPFVKTSCLFGVQTCRGGCSWSVPRFSRPPGKSKGSDGYRSRFSETVRSLVSLRFSPLTLSFVP